MALGFIPNSSSIALSESASQAFIATSCGPSCTTSCVSISSSSTPSAVAACTAALPPLEPRANCTIRATQLDASCESAAHRGLNLKLLGLHGFFGAGDVDFVDHFLDVLGCVSGEGLDREGDGEVDQHTNKSDPFWRDAE